MQIKKQKEQVILEMEFDELKIIYNIFNDLIPYSKELRNHLFVNEFMIKYEDFLYEFANDKIKKY